MFLKHKRLIKTFLPKHVAIIMDGNRRWAKKKSLERKIGHYEGAKNLKKIITECIKLEIPYLTVYAFSTENWHRNNKEIDELVSLLNDFLNREISEIIDHKIKINILGQMDKFPKEIQQKLKNIISRTKNFNKLHCNIALNYGSREEIIYAVNNLLKNKTSTAQLTIEDLTQYLYTKNIPDPDLMIRTSGEYRLSNFLLWQSAYSELYFSKKLWPEFTIKEFHKSLIDYSKRKRRFGR